MGEVGLMAVVTPVSWVDVDRRLREFEADHSEAPAEEVAASFVASLRREQLEALLAELLRAEIAGIRRARVRDLERVAAQAKAVAEYPAREAEWARSKAEREAMWRANPSAAPRNSRVFREWATTEAGRAFVDHKAREAEEQAEKDRLYEENPVEWDRRYGFRFWLNRFEDETRQRVRLELTAELLGSSFAVGDGRHVTWGEATLRDHQLRVEYLLRQAGGSVETAAIHERAAAMLREKGASCLNELA